jgi:HAD superfamily hydrolase (TIGR01509 family)
LTILNCISIERNISIPADVEVRVDQLTLRLAKDSVREIRGATEVIHTLAGSNVSLGIASDSALRTVVALLDHIGVLEYFAGCIATRDQVREPKPSPDVYLLAARMLSVQPEACVAVEDYPAGVSAARAANMTVVGFCPPAGTHSADRLLASGAIHVVDDLNALRQLIAPP